MRSDANVRAEAGARRALIGAMRGVESATHDAGARGELHRRLSDFLDSDVAHARIALYIPFEWLPDLPFGEAGPDATRFAEAYFRRWRELLAISDVRANFFDGDIPEPELRMGDLPRVVKAAHLAPWLLQKGMLSEGEFVELATSARDEFLRGSLGDAAAHMRGAGALSAEAVAALGKTLARPLEARTAIDPDAPIPPARAAWLRRRDARREARPDARVGGAADSRFEAPFSEREEFMDWAAGPLGRALMKIESESELAELIYPAILAFGSRLKGYGEADADLDAAVFVRAGADPGARHRVTAALNRAFAEELFGGKVVEFWLDPDGPELRVRDFERPDVSLAGSDWAHILFGAAWFGNETAIRELHARLLPRYLENGGAAPDRRAMREHWLEEMERDVLQYRLMHDGYARFRAPESGLAGEGSGRLDGASAFWDAGYRRLATRHFAGRVFLPKIGSREA